MLRQEHLPGQVVYQSRRILDLLYHGAQELINPI